VRDGSGRLIPYTELFSKHFFDYEKTGYEVRENTPEEIESAVRDFVSDLKSPASCEDLRGKRVLESLPDYVITKYLNCRVSKAWLSLYDAEDKRLTDMNGV
jgi:hypothetical protein